MGLLDGLFEKKRCGICHQELGLFDKNKVEDGYVCDSCAAKASPWFQRLRKSTISDVRAHLTYRQGNEGEVRLFNTTRTIALGASSRLMVDDSTRKFLITSSEDWKSANPDVMSISQVTGCDYTVSEYKNEIMDKDAEGHEVSFEPRRYNTDYDIYVMLYVNSPWFSQIRLKVNDKRIDRRDDPEFEAARLKVSELRILFGIEDSIPKDEFVEKNDAPKVKAPDVMSRVGAAAAAGAMAAAAEVRGAKPIPPKPAPRPEEQPQHKPGLFDANKQPAKPNLFNQEAPAQRQQPPKPPQPHGGRSAGR